MESRNTNSEIKPPSSRSTITTEEISDDDVASDKEDSAYEDGEEKKMMEMGHKSIREIEIEKEMQMHMNRTDNLLYSVFPKHIAELLRQGKKVEPANHDCVTIFFSDIVGFTDISTTLDALKISDLLDRLYHSFDTLSHYHDVFKVETIGDAYMAVTNLTKEQPDHCKRIAEFSMDAIRAANQTLIDKDDPGRGHVNIRVGFHTGPVVSNVVGSRNPRYCLFGDTVNTASRMESNSEVNRIHCSEDSAKLLLSQNPEIKIAPRGLITVKGKGKMNTFWVNEDESTNSKTSLKKQIFNLVSRKQRSPRRGSVI
jgi:class 3 adenylate cyclase